MFTPNFCLFVIISICLYHWLFYSSFGNVLAPTSNVLEVIFSICITLGGLALFTTLVANIQVTYKSHYSLVSHMMAPKYCKNVEHVVLVLLDIRNRLTIRSSRFNKGIFAHARGN